MKSRYSTHLLPFSERQDYWKQVIADTYFPLELEIANPAQFHGQLSQWQMGQVNISRLDSSATRFKRLEQQIDNSEPYILITIPAHAAVRFTQANHTLVCSPGAFILERSDLPYEFSFHKDNALWVLRVPLALLRTRLREPERFLYMEFDKSRGMGNIFYGFMRNMVQQAPYTDTSIHSALSQQLIDLLAYALEQDDRVLMSQEAGIRSAHLRNIEAFVKENIQRSDLSPDMIASACNISTRYLHKLFKESDQTVSQWIRELRLQATLHDIRTKNNFSTLAEIAYRWGFNDQAHFCRLFKDRFGCTPKAMRDRG